MTTEGNYKRFRGKDNNGVKKMQYANVLAEKMKAETNTESRNAKQVLDKIKRLEDSFREAHVFATSETGAGIQERDGKGTFEDIVRRKCAYYYQLVDIMGDRSGTEPVLTNREPSDLDVYTSDEEEAVAANVDSPVIQNLGDLADDKTRTSVEESASTRKNKKPRTRGKNSNQDDETVALLSTANESAENRMKELQRHNEQIEQIEREKVDLERKKLGVLEWKGKSDELDYKMKLVRQYQELKATMSDSQILRMFPEMDSVINAMKDTLSE
jgi:hypothetical protein